MLPLHVLEPDELVRVIIIILPLPSRGLLTFSSVVAQTQYAENIFLWEENAKDRLLNNSLAPQLVDQA